MHGIVPAYVAPQCMPALYASAGCAPTDLAMPQNRIQGVILLSKSRSHVGRELQAACAWTPAEFSSQAAHVIADGADQATLQRIAAVRELVIAQ